jgi:hypothetical protein
MNFTTAEIFRNIVIHQASQIWIGLLLISSLVTLLLSIASMILHIITSTPDILVYVPSLKRNNPNVVVPAGATTLDGPKSTRLLRGLKVRLRDNHPHDEIGYYAVQSIEDDEVVLWNE